MNEKLNDQKKGELTDRVGAIASSLCALHCAICALAPFILTGLGLGVLLSHEAEWGLTLGAITFGIGAMYLGWRKHRSAVVMGILAVGIVGLLTARVLEMNSDHHGHHDEHQDEKHAEHHEEGEEHGEEESEEHSEEAGHDEEHEGDHHEGEHHEDGLSLHDLGAAAGFGGGLVLFMGHLLNIRATRRCREDLC